MIQIAHADPRIPYYVRLTLALWSPYDGGLTSCVRKAIKNRFQNASDALKREAKHDLNNKVAKVTLKKLKHIPFLLFQNAFSLYSNIT